MTTIEDHGKNLLRKVWADLQRASQAREIDEIKTNPDAHRLTRIMSAGANTGYSYYNAGEHQIGKTRKEKIRFCRSTHKNAAGVYLIWRQVDRLKLTRGRWQWYQAERFDFQWSPTRSEARDIILRKAEKAKSLLAKAV